MATSEMLLSPTPASVADSRRFVREALSQWDREDLADVASLVTSELVTNAVLHAGTDVRVKLNLDRCLRIEVHDRSRALPRLKHYSADATTGRGLRLVARLADAWGVDHNDVKYVWCEVCGTPGHPVTEEAVDLDDWPDLEDASPPPGRSPGLVDVWLLGLPVPVYCRAQEHSDGLARELLLITRDLVNPHPPLVRLFGLIGRLAARYGRLNPAAERRLRRAVDSGLDEVDVLYRVPPSTKDDVQQLDAVLREADEYCRRGQDLLTLATPPEALAFREWVFGEIARQIDGEPPCPWPSRP